MRMPTLGCTLLVPARLLALALSLVLVQAMSGAAPAAFAAAQSGSEGYQPYAAEAAARGVDVPCFVLAAYSAVLVLLILLVALLYRRQQRIRAEIERLEREPRRPSP